MLSYRLKNIQFVKIFASSKMKFIEKVLFNNNGIFDENPLLDEICFSKSSEFKFTLDNIIHISEVR